MIESEEKSLAPRILPATEELLSGCDHAPDDEVRLYSATTDRGICEVEWSREVNAWEAN